MAGDPEDELARLRRVARRLLWSGLALLALSGLTWLGSGLHERFAPFGDGSLSSVLAALVLYSVAPVGLVLLLLALLAGAWAWWVGGTR